MKFGKTCFVAMTVVLCLSLTAAKASAADTAQVLQEQTEKLLQTLVAESKTRASAENVNLFKQAGLSYQPSLVLPLKGIVDCKDNQQLQVLMGMYNFDANYALLFGRKQEFAKAYELRNDIPDRLNLMGRFTFRRFTPEEIEKILNNPDDPANRSLYVNYIAANLYDMFQAAKTDPEILDLAMDFSYGAIIESFYIACKLALAAGTGEALIPLFNEQAVRMGKVWQGLEAYAVAPELDTVTERPRRERILKPVAEILRTKKGNLTEGDVKEILSIIEPERSRVASICP